MKTTKRALFSSVMALILCFSMLVGTTFAWFTDSVESGVNQIVAGTLDVELYNAIGIDETKKVSAGTKLFDEIKYWEPGVVAYENLTVANLGNLALKYQLSVNFDNATANVNGETLAKVLKVAFVKGGISGYSNDAAGRTALINKLTEDGAWQPLASFVEPGKLEQQNDAQTYGIVIYWEPSDIDNDFNMNNGKGGALSIDLGIKLVATQLSGELAESDSFGPDYDAGAPWMGGIDISWYTQNPAAQEFVLNSSEDLAGFAAIVNGTATNDMMRSASTQIHDDFAGKTVKLAADLDLNGNPWTPIGRIGTTSTDFTYAFKGTFDGQNHTIYNLDVDAYGWAGVFGLAYQAQINNLKVDGVAITANRLAGAVVGQLYGSIDNCHVSNAQIMVTPNAVGDSYDNGDKVGGIVGWLGDNGNNRTLTNCSATDVELSAYRDVGGIAGYVAWSTKIANNKADKINITVDQVSHFYGEKDPNAGAIWGRNSVSSTGVGVIDENNTVGEEISISSTISKAGLTYVQDGVTGEMTFYLVPADYEGTTVNVAEGTTTIGRYAFYYNSNIEKIVLPSTVTKLDIRAFRGTSASTVVLNEGLTNISYQAFRDALNVTSVEIPSTVTTISDSAFQYSGITTLTIPATVTTVEYGACRDMKMVETVIIEGNADIPEYAFRACTNLKTVVLKGEDVTFGGGSRGMIFTNKESGDGTAITVYVANEAVKERLLAADTAAKDYGGYKIVVGLKPVEDTDDLAGSFSDGADTVFVPAGEYSFPASSLGEGDTLLCAPGTVFEGTSSLNVNGATVVGGTFANDSGYAVSGTINGTFKDCVFDSSEALRWCYSGETVVFENCEFKTDFRGVHFDGMNYDVIFRNCKLNGFNAFGGTATVTFEGCTFGYDESYYNGLNMYCNTVLKDCKFEYRSGKINFIDFEAAGKNLTITNCTATLDGEPANVIDFVGGTYVNQTNITVDGAVLKSAASQSELNSAVSSDDKVAVELAAGNYTLPSAVAGKEVTISGSEDTVIDVTSSINMGSGDLVFDGVTVLSNGGGFNNGIQHVDTIVYQNATIVGSRSLYGNKEVFINCTFDLTGVSDYIWVYGANEAEFINCTFNTNGKALLIYNEGDGDCKVTVKGCTFNATTGAKAGDISNQNCAAIEIYNFANSGVGQNHTLITEGNTINGDFSGEWRIKNFMAGGVVTVNGIQYTKTALDGRLMTVTNKEATFD